MLYQEVRDQVMSNLSTITRGDDLIDNMLSETSIQERAKDDKRDIATVLTDTYYRYKYLFALGSIPKQDQKSIEEGSTLYKLIPVLNEEIDNLQDKPSLDFKMEGIPCVKCGSTNTITELQQVSSGDEPRISKITCIDCGFVKR